MAVRSPITTFTAARWKTGPTQQDNYLKWLNLAYLIFDSEGRSYWNHAGNGWNKDFGDGHYINFIDFMQKQSKSSGDDRWKSSGISIAESLSDVQGAGGQ